MCLDVCESREVLRGTQRTVHCLQRREEGRERIMTALPSSERETFQRNTFHSLEDLRIVFSLSKKSMPIKLG